MNFRKKNKNGQIKTKLKKQARFPWKRESNFYNHCRCYTLPIVCTIRYSKWHSDFPE